MPDDDLMEVAEPEVTETPEPEDVLKNESEAFEVDDDVTDETVDKQPEPEKEPEKSDESEDSEDAESEETDDEDESDEDVKRGKEILAEKQAEEDRKKQDEESKEKKDDEPIDLRNESFDTETVNKLASYIPKKLLPESATLEDGTELDFKTVMSDYPELPHIVAAYANNIIRQMIGTGFIVSGDRLRSFDQDMDRRSYIRAVTHPQYGVPEAGKIVQSDEYKSWIEKQPPEITALRESNNPHDMIRVLKRFKGEGILGDAKKQAEEHDNKRKEKKETYDAVHKADKRKRSSGKPKTTAVDGKAEEMEAFLSDDDD